MVLELNQEAAVGIERTDQTTGCVEDLESGVAYPAGATGRHQVRSVGAPRQPASREDEPGWMLSRARMLRLGSASYRSRCRRSPRGRCRSTAGQRANHRPGRRQRRWGVACRGGRTEARRGQPTADRPLLAAGFGSGMSCGRRTAKTRPVPPGTPPARPAPLLEDRVQLQASKVVEQAGSNRSLFPSRMEAGRLAPVGREESIREPISGIQPLAVIAGFPRADARRRAGYRGWRAGPPHPAGRSRHGRSASCSRQIALLRIAGQPLGKMPAGPVQQRGHGATSDSHHRGGHLPVHNRGRRRTHRLSFALRQ